MRHDRRPDLVGFPQGTRSWKHIGCPYHRGQWLMPGENRMRSLGAGFGDSSQVAGTLEQLESLREPLTSDMPIESLETFEASWKHALSEIMTVPLTGSDARRVAVFQRDIGLL